MNLLRRLAAPLSFLAFLGLWQIGALLTGSPLILPLPLEVFRALGENLGNPVFLKHFGASALRVLGAIVLAVAAGSGAGLCSGINRTFRAFMVFPLTIIRAVPVAAIILLSVFWLGSDGLPVFAAFLMSLPVMTDAVTGSIEKTPPRLLAAARVYGFSRKKLFFQVYLPSGLPNFLSGLRSVFGLCWKVVIAAEVLVLPRVGAGSLLYSAKVHLESAQVYAITILMIVLCFCLETLLALLIKHRGSAKISLQQEQRTLSTDQGTLPRTDKTNSAATESAKASHTALCIENLGIRRGNLELFRSFSADFPQGSLTAIIAASGRGKTTLLDCISDILSPDKGRVFLRGDPDTEPKTGFSVSYLFQEPELLPWRSILRNTALPLAPALSPKEAQNIAAAFLTQAGLGTRLGSYPAQLSGGECQRAALARAFAYPAPVLLMDEAFQSQDMPLKLSLMELAKKLLAQNPRTVIMVTHDVREALCLADRILVLTGRPLSVARDITLSQKKNRDAPVAEQYIHISPELVAVEADIFTALSGDMVF